MGKKSKKYCPTSSETSSSSILTETNCCKNYPTCKGFCSSSSISKYPCPIPPQCNYKYFPTYYPNNCLPFPPCPPIPPVPPQLSTPYTVNQTITTVSTSLSPTSPNVNLFNMSVTAQSVSLPLISLLSGTNYIKMFVISNISSSISFTVVSSGKDILTNTCTNTFILGFTNTITLYAVYIPGGTSYWVCN